MLVLIQVSALDLLSVCSARQSSPRVSPRGLRSPAALSPRQGGQHLPQGPQGWSGCLRQAQPPRGRLYHGRDSRPQPRDEEFIPYIQFKGTPRKPNPRRPSRNCCKALSHIRRPMTIQGATSEPDPKGKPPELQNQLCGTWPTSPLERGNSPFLTPDCFKEFAATAGIEESIHMQQLEDQHLPRMPLRSQVLRGYHQKLQNPLCGTCPHHHFKEEIHN